MTSFLKRRKSNSPYNRHKYSEGTREKDYNRDNSHYNRDNSLKGNNHYNYEYQHDFGNDHAEFKCEKIDNLNGLDPQLRFISLGIVNVVEPLKNEILYTTPMKDKREKEFPRKLRGNSSANTM